MITQEMLNLPGNNLLSLASNLRSQIKTSRLQQSSTKSQAKFIKAGLYLIVLELWKDPRSKTGQIRDPAYWSMWGWVRDAYDCAKQIRNGIKDPKLNDSLIFTTKLALEQVEIWGAKQ